MRVHRFGRLRRVLAPVGLFSVYSENQGSTLCIGMNRHAHSVVATCKHPSLSLLCGRCITTIAACKHCQVPDFWHTVAGRVCYLAKSTGCGRGWKLSGRLSEASILCAYVEAAGLHLCICLIRMRCGHYNVPMQMACRSGGIALVYLSLIHI